MVKVITLITAPLVLILILSVSVLCQVKNLSEDQWVTDQIRRVDPYEIGFLKEFTIYSAETAEGPTALLFDYKDDSFHIPSRQWGEPLSEKEIAGAIKQLDIQQKEHPIDIPLKPRALAIVNTKGKILGYGYTGVKTFSMKREKSGQVTVYPPIIKVKPDWTGGAGQDGGAQGP